MSVRKLSRWQKAGVLVPMAVLVGAWGVALTSSSFAAQSDGHSPGVPQVPSTAFEQPATVESGTPGGIDAHAGSVGTIATLSTNGIPAAALLAYKQAAALLDKADPSCHLPWTLVAAIGRVESNHGRSGGNTLNAKGISEPGVYGVALDGKNGTSLVNDTDNGQLDGDPVYDRAVGPMQFLPSTWKVVGVDADGDGKKNPQDINDAATAAGVYLCSGSGDLSTTAGASDAVHRYNHSDSYVSLVLAIEKKYAAGDFSQSPDGYTASSVITSKSQDQTLSASQRASAKKQADKAEKSGKGSKGGKGATGTSGGSGTPTGGTTGGSAGGGTTGGGTSGGGSSSGGSSGGSSSGSSGSVSGLVGGIVNGVGGTSADGTTSGDPVTNTLTWAQAKVQCLANGISSLNLLALAKCITDLLA